MAETLIATYLAGKTLKVEVVRLSDGKRLDWADGTFKASGWTTRQQPMTEDVTTPTPGYYTLAVDVSNAANWLLTTEFLFMLTDAAVASAIVMSSRAAVAAGQLVENRKIADLARRFMLVNGVEVDQDSTQRILREDGSTLATSPVALSGITQKLGPAVVS